MKRIKELSSDALIDDSRATSKILVFNNNNNNNNNKKRDWTIIETWNWNPMQSLPHHT